jgi:hypothetical protein
MAWFEGPDFLSSVGSTEEVRAEEAWLVCAICLALVEHDDRDGLVERGLARSVRADGAPREVMPGIVENLHERFWAARPG